MSNEIENPNAFPVLDPNSGFWQPGMQLRDYFAAKAMQGIMSKYGISEEDYTPKKAYDIADAMLTERQK